MIDSSIFQYVQMNTVRYFELDCVLVFNEKELPEEIIIIEE